MNNQKSQKKKIFFINFENKSVKKRNEKVENKNNKTDEKN
jgi:hypothetical protein